MKQTTIVWNIAHRCNYNCRFCFGPLLDGKEISKDEACCKIKELSRSGFQRIVFTGGEPTLREDLAELIIFAKKEGLATILNTNGFKLTEDFLERVEPYLDQINLPLDGYDDETCAVLRPPGHFAKVMERLRLLKNYKFVVVVSSVVTRQNISWIDKIASVLPPSVDKWRIFEFNPVGKAKARAEEFCLAEGEFAKLRRRIPAHDHTWSVQFVPRDDQAFYESYHLLD